MSTKKLTEIALVLAGSSPFGQILRTLMGTVLAEDTWSKIESDVNAAIEKAVRKAEFKAATTKTQSLLTSLKAYDVATYTRRGQKMPILLAKCREIVPVITKGTDRHLVLPMALEVALVHMTLLGDRLHNGEDMWPGTSAAATAIHRNELDRTIAYYRSTLPRMFQEWKYWIWKWRHAFLGDHIGADYKIEGKEDVSLVRKKLFHNVVNQMYKSYNWLHYIERFLVGPSKRRVTPTFVVFKDAVNVWSPNPHWADPGDTKKTLTDRYIDDATVVLGPEMASTINLDKDTERVLREKKGEVTVPKGIDGRVMGATASSSGKISLHGIYTPRITQHHAPDWMYAPPDWFDSNTSGKTRALRDYYTDVEIYTKQNSVSEIVIDGYKHIESLVVDDRGNPKDNILTKAEYTSAHKNGVRRGSAGVYLRLNR